MNDRLAWIDEALSDLTRRGLRRQRITRAAAQGPMLQIDGQRLVNLGSNDYLGLAGDARLVEAARCSLETEGWGAGASPLITGRGEAHRKLEADLADFEGAEAALLFPSGFAANVGTIAALVERGDAVFGDAKNHASIIDGCRLSRADVHVYPHADVAALAKLLQSHRGYQRRLIVSDTLFSMDGDLAPLVELVELAEQHDCMLLVDEAHATGVLGENGRGLAEARGVEHRIDVRIGTLSKALGCAGGFVAGSAPLIEWLVNRARPYVFSTAQPAAGAAAASEALAIVRNEPARRAELLNRAAWLRERLREQGWNVGHSESQIIPILLGEADATMQAAAALRSQGILVPGIRPPSVPPGESLLRISLCYGHTQEMLEGLLEALAALKK